MSNTPNSERPEYDAARAAASAYQAAEHPGLQSAYLTSPSFPHDPRALPHIANHPNAHLFFPNAVATTMDQVSFFMGIRSILEGGGTNLTAEEFIEQIREDFPPSRLLHPSVLKDGNFHKKLRALMETLGVNLVEHPQGMKRLIARRIAYTIYNGDEYSQERELSDHLLSSYRTFNPITGFTPINAAAAPHDPLIPSGLSSRPPPNQVPPHTPSTQSQYKSLVYSFKDRSSKYGGELDQNWADSIRQYETTTEIAELSPADKLRCLPLMLHDDALTFFTVSVKPVATDYDHACILLSNRFHGRSRQMRIKAKLLSLSIQQFHTDGQALDVTLTKLSSYIQKNFPLVPSTYQCEDNKIDILMKAVRLQPWADSAIQSLENSSSSYEGFLSKLSYGLQTYLDSERLRGNEIPSLSDVPLAVNYQHSHGRYGNPLPSYRKPFTRHDSAPKCWNCGNSNCRVSRCPKPIDAKQIAASKLSWLNRSRPRQQPATDHYKRVLLEFVEELDDALKPDCDSSPMMSDAQVDTFFTTDCAPDDADTSAASSVPGSTEDDEAAAINHFDILSSCSHAHAETDPLDAHEGF